VILRGCGPILLSLLLSSGCALFHPTPQTTTLSGYDFAKVFDNYTLYTDVWYMGTDSQNHHFCMEHWTLKADGSNATMDKRDFYQVSVLEWNIVRPFALTTDETQWRLLRPKRPPAF